jgi:putative ABC transport system permease protein
VKLSLLSVAVRNLRRKSFRTAVLIVSISLFVSILVFGSSFIISVGASIQRASDRFGADLLVVPSGTRDYAEEVLLETKVKEFYMDKELVEKVRNIDGIVDVTYQIYMETIWGACCDVPAAKVVAFDQDTDFIVKPWLNKTLGRKLRKGEAIIGHQAYDNLGLLDVESSVLFNMKFDIAGVLEKTGTGFDNAIFMLYENVDDIIDRSGIDLEEGKVSIIFTKVAEGLDPYKVGMTVEGELIEVDVIERSDMGERIISTLMDINRVFLITIVLASVLSGFLAWSVFSAIVNERVKEVGIMRALGAKGSHIVRMFLLEVFMLGLLGSVIGMAIGTYMSLSLSEMFTLLKNMTATLTAAERISINMMGLLVGTGICVVGALSSILRIRKLEPLVALKED